MFKAISGITSERATIFVHGTLPPVIATLTHLFDCPLGLTRAKAFGVGFMNPTIANVLYNACPEEFPLESFYFFGWSGVLSFAERELAAYKLYEILRKFKGYITVIGHSHGGNLALQLAEIAQKYKDTDFKIDRLLLLATPVQQATARFIDTPVFRKVISFYSKTDFIQIIDLQKYYSAPYKRKYAKKQLTFFSKRVFNAAPNLSQIRVLIDQRDPWHIDFMRPLFLKHLSEIIKLCNQDNGTINIPKIGKPYYVAKGYIAQDRKWLIEIFKFLEFICYQVINKKIK